MLRRGGRIAPFTRRALIVLPIWVFCTLWAWTWWLSPIRDNFPLVYIPLTAALMYELSLMPGMLLMMLIQARRPANLKPRPGIKVAVITPCVPSSESMAIIERQLKALAAIEYPHDSWILDEGGSLALKKLAAKHGVKYFSRKGIVKYNTADHPFKAKTKAGNVNAWLDSVKRRNYEFVTQLDIDHIPEPNYLHKVLGHFRNKKVAWVQAPSVYGNRDFWTARGASEQELPLQGPLQMGFYKVWDTPIVTGSHCTFRTSALKEIGGFQRTRAEDQLNTQTLASHGYRGVYVPDVIARGDGPETLNAYLVQQFAWAYSVTQVLLRHSLPLMERLPWSKRGLFLFLQTWYPAWSTANFIMFLAPIVALLANREITTMNANDFLERVMPLALTIPLIWWAAKPLMQPNDLTLSWRGILLNAARWPVALNGVVFAMLGAKKPYMITPKGKGANALPQLATYTPYLLLGLLSAGAVILSTIAYGQSASEGQIIFALSNAGFMLTICLVDLNVAVARAKKAFLSFWPLWYRAATAIIALALVITVAVFTTPGISNGLAAALGPTPRQPIYVTPGKSINSMTTSELIAAIRRLPANPNAPTQGLGIFDPRDRLYSKQTYIRHSFVGWKEYRRMATQLLLTLRGNNTPLISIDPNGVSNGAKLLSGISNGIYDATLLGMTRVLSASKTTVYVRFAHEMDLAKYYAWGAQDPQLFIAAYRHVVDYVRSHGGTNIRWVWAPAGGPQAAAYYPGNDYVDVVGATLLYDRFWSKDFYPTFYDIAADRLWLNGYHKPVWIVEFGVGRADATFQRHLIADAITRYRSLGFSALLYINIPDSNEKGPDYRLHSYDEFADWLSATPFARLTTKPTTAPAKKPYTKPTKQPTVLVCPTFTLPQPITAPTKPYAQTYCFPGK